MNKLLKSKIKAQNTTSCSRSVDDMGTFDSAPAAINVNNNYVYDAQGRLIKDLQEEIDKIIWTAANKVKEIRRTSLSDKENLVFDYDAAGRRIAKHVYDKNWILLKSTYYVLDGNGTPVNIYEHSVDGSTAAYYLTERNIYGGSRLGTVRDTVNLFNPIALPSYGIIGNRSYEETNHLGNVLAVVSDVVYPISANSSDIDYYQAGIIQAIDYSPFGVQLDGRNLSLAGADDYRFGFQGYEGDSEIKGAGNSYTTEFRQYDPRLGRWLTTDPKGIKYPDMSPYNAYANNPIINIDLKGDTIARFTWDGKYLGWIDDGKAKWTGRRENAIANKDENGNIISYSHEYFSFADPINDPKSLKNGTITHLVFVYDEDIKKMLKTAGAFDPDNQGSLNGSSYLQEEGKGGGRFDFSLERIPRYNWREEISFDLSPMLNATDVLFYVKSQKTAHNHFNFGNFMFGAGGKALGVDLGILLWGGHYNSWSNAETNGYSPQPDSNDDQLSITLGFIFARDNKYDKIQIEDKKSTTTNEGR